MYKREFVERQRYGRNKETTINHSYINSGEYRNKFDFITNDEIINRLIYKIAKDILKHRSGSEYEDMYWIDPISKSIIAGENSQTLEKRVIYSKQTRKRIKRYKHLITIHNHPSGFPPSIDDFNSNYKNKYGMGIVCGHDGSVFIYTSEEEIPKSFFRKKVEYYKKLGYNDYDAQIETITKLSERHNIKCKEVRL